VPSPDFRVPEEARNAGFFTVQTACMPFPARPAPLPAVGNAAEFAYIGRSF
jgi:hypothetical protein